MGARAVVAAIGVLVTPAALACGSSRNTATAAPGDASGGAGSGVAAACDDFFDALAGCLLVPQAAAAHGAPRFRQFCENQAALPGSATTAANIEACAQAYTADCSSTCELPSLGTLPAGAPCNIGWGLQCQSGVCAELPLPDGGYPASCGACAASIPVGQPCSPGGAGTCVQGSYCAGATSQTCVAYGDAGAACSPALSCQWDLVCSSAKVCEPKASAGGVCSSDMDCAEELPCVGGECSPRAGSGEHCTESGYSTPCDLGLDCDTATSTCVAPTAQPGSGCGANGQLCIYGSCNKEGVCPSIVADGQPCPTNDTATCDYEATCDVTGKCSIPGSNACP
jgi:hypothetical protein